MNTQSTSPARALPFARSFKELAVYQKARTLSREVFKTTKGFPREEAFSLTDQWRRAVLSIGAQISEAWTKRRYPRHFLSKLTDADGEQMETQHWIIVAFDQQQPHAVGEGAFGNGHFLGLGGPGDRNQAGQDQQHRHWAPGCGCKPFEKL